MPRGGVLTEDLAARLAFAADLMRSAVEEQAAVILACRDENVSSYEIAKRLGISHTNVLSIERDARKAREERIEP